MNRQKVAVITGVSSGIGQGLSKQFLSQNWKVYGTVRDPKDAEKLSANYIDFRWVQMDVTDQLSIQTAIDGITKDCEDGIDLLINNAGIAVGGPLMHVPMEEMRYQFEVNVFGLLAVTKACYPLLKENEAKPAGRIIQMSSVSGKVGFPFLGPYVASKFALEGLSESLRRELLIDKIKVITVGPGAVKTPIWEKSVNPVAEKYRDTRFAAAIKRLNENFVSQSIKSALTVGNLSKKIYDLAVDSNPGTRYTFMSRKLTNYLLPKLLPSKMMDRIIGNKLYK
jgi:NAD(P)-dependent dehydrogenase (short-subunit alcohol dehydrogenase family)